MMPSNICVLLTFLILYQRYTIDAETIYVDCGSKVGHIDSLTITGCHMKPRKSQPVTTGKSEPCMMRKGTNVTLLIKFTPEVASNSAIIKVWGNESVVPYQLPIEPDACFAWGTKCPLVKGVKNIVNITVFISPEYPSISGGVTSILYDDKSNQILCAYFEGELKKKKV